MTTFIWNLLLALLWGGITGRFSAENLLLGFLIAYLALRLPRGDVARTRYFQKVWQAVAFTLFFFREALLSAVRVAHDVLTRKIYMRPAVIGIPLDTRSDAEITLLANLISLTPGSLALVVSADRKTLFIHMMFVNDVEAARIRQKRGFERRVLELLR